MNDKLRGEWIRKQVEERDRQPGMKLNPEIWITSSSEWGRSGERTTCEGLLCWGRQYKLLIKKEVLGAIKCLAGIVWCQWGDNCVICPAGPPYATHFFSWDITCSEFSYMNHTVLSLLYLMLVVVLITPFHEYKISHYNCSCNCQCI